MAPLPYWQCWSRRKAQNRFEFSKWSVLLRLRFPLGSTLVLSLKEAPMKSRPFPEIPCVICSKPVNLQTELCADENGKAVHEDCYVKQITSSHNNRPPAMIAN